MLRLSGILLLCLALSGCGGFKKAVKSKEFWLTTAAISAAAVVDGQSTVSVLKRCPTCVETNPLFGTRRPSTRRLYLVGGAFIVGERVLIASLWKKQTARDVNLLLTGAHISYHTYFTIRNNQLDQFGRR
jgi:hypothetical protein